MSESREIFLNVKPFCNEPQLIHMESTSGCNIAFVATFDCTENDGNTLKLKKVVFEMYPMATSFDFGFGKVEAKREKNHEGLRVIEFDLEIGSNEKTKTLEFKDGEEIIWNYNDTIDNKIRFKVGPITIEREDMKELFKSLDMDYDFEGAVPTIDRPCRFKLVSEI